MKDKGDTEYKTQCKLYPSGVYVQCPTFMLTLEPMNK